MTLPRVRRGTGEGVGPRAARGVLLSRQGELLLRDHSNAVAGLVLLCCMIGSLCIRCHGRAWCRVPHAHSWHYGAATVGVLLHCYGATLNASLMGTKARIDRWLNRRSCSDRSVPVTFDATEIRVCCHASFKDGATFFLNRQFWCI